MSLTVTPPFLQAFTPSDVQAFRLLLRQQYFQLARKYILLVAFMILVGCKVNLTFTGPGRHAAAIGYLLFCLLFGTSILVFLSKDINGTIRLILAELKTGQKNCYTFYAKKYFDPIFKHCLLFYPDKENLYILIDAGSFDAIAEDDILYMEQSILSDTIIQLRSDTVTAKLAAPYRFR